MMEELKELISQETAKLICETHPQVCALRDYNYPKLEQLTLQLIFADKENIREVIAFPLNQQAKDLMMGSPAPLTPEQWEELNLMLKPKKEEMK